MVFSDLVRSMDVFVEHKKSVLLCPSGLVSNSMNSSIDCRLHRDV